MSKPMETDWKILLIDPDAEVRKVMVGSLEVAGYIVVTAPDWELGLLRCRMEAPDIVIMDIGGPGIDGIGVLRRIKETNPDAEVIVTTGFSDPETAARVLHLDASDFITKPINHDTLMGALNHAKELHAARKNLSDYTMLIEERWMSAAEALAKASHFRQMLIESSIDGIMACDSQGKTIILNEAMTEMLGYSKDDVVGKMFLSQFFAPGEAERFYKTLASEEYGGKDRVFLYESTLMDKTGREVQVQVSGAVLFEEGCNVGVVGFFRDLTTIRKLTRQVDDQARILHQDKMISLGRLAASVVHEINNPLSGILNYVRLMLKVIGRGPLIQESVEKFKGYLLLMDGELSRCSEIVSNLLAFSRKSKLEFCEVSINDLITRSLTLSDHKLTLQNIKTQTRLPAESPRVLGDFNQLQQCLINLIFNAIDAMPQGGILTLECTPDCQRELVSIRVQDTGCGIPKEDILHIFDPFYTTKKEGKSLGLGLSTVYGIIDRHKGAIAVESEPGKGTTFIIKLPAGKGKEIVLC